jgi:DNA-binding NarL/FixJ family response regulator
VTPVRVFHCDDSAAFRLLVREMLRELGGDVEIIGHAANVEDAVTALPSADPDVVLLDLFEGATEDELVSRLRPAAPEARFVVYSGMPKRTGDTADGHLHKGAAFDELHRVITEVAGRA